MFVVTVVGVYYHFDDDVGDGTVWNICGLDTICVLPLTFQLLLLAYINLLPLRLPHRILLLFLTS